MLMKEELARLVIEGKKRQTRRPIKAGEVLVTIDGVRTVMAGKRIKYQVGREYSLQYGRGLPTRLWKDGELLSLADYQANVDKHGKITAGWVLYREGYRLLKYKLLDIWAEDVRWISEDDAIAEGFNHEGNWASYNFLKTWAGFYDKPFLKIMNARPITDKDVRDLSHNLYQAWALKFEVVKYE